MRNMPTFIHDLDGNAAEVPSIPAAEWFEELAKIGGRDLTDDERQQAEKMANHNWTLRVVASKLFGESRVDAYYAAK